MSGFCVSKTALAICGLALVSLQAWGALGPPSPLARAQQGAESSIEVSSVEHPDTKVRWGRAATELAAPQDEVLRVVEDYAGYKNFLPHFRTSRVLSQRA